MTLANLPPPAWLPQAFVNDYDGAISTFIHQHPFLDGTGRNPSGAVFSAVITAHALLECPPDTASIAEVRAGNGPNTPNPFLIEFYLDRVIQLNGDNPVILPEHVVILYESIKARAGVNDRIQLTIEGDNDNDNADVEILIGDNTRVEPVTRILFQTPQAGQLRLGRQISDVVSESPYLDVIIGSGNPVEIIAPVSISIANISFNCPEIVFKRGDGDDNVVTLEAESLITSNINGMPIVRSGVELMVSWPGCKTYPWISFADAINNIQMGDIENLLRPLRKLITAFRSHSKGNLARYKGKIEHSRMSKNGGDVIREQLLKDDILPLSGPMYILDPNALGSITGASYTDLRLMRFNEQVQKYIASIVKH